MVTRRTLLSTALSGGVLGTLGTGGLVGTASGSHDETDGERSDRVQRIEPDPEYGFNYPYYLATPERYRTGEIPLMVEMNNADETLSREEERERAYGQVRMLDAQGAWLSEELGVPHLKPLFHEPVEGAGRDELEIALLDRTAMLLEDDDLERVDLQLLRMADHAREVHLADELDGIDDASLHEQFVMYGNSSEGNSAEKMALMHPEEIHSIVAAGINGFVGLPLEALGGRTLEYPVGVADFESILGKSYDPDAHDAVNTFFVQGGSDPSNRLIMDKEEGLRRNNWDDEEIYDTARIVYGPRMVEDRFPRCQIAFERADVSAQFRVYPEMSHDPTPASHAMLAFLDRSIEGEDVSDFGQRLRLPFDRTIELATDDPAVGADLRFAISGEFPPPEGLVTYTWETDSGQSASGPEATFTFDEPGAYDLTLAMETAHGQFAQRGLSLVADGSSFGALQYAVEPPGPQVVVDEPTSIGIDVRNVGSVAADRRLELLIDDESVDSRDVEVAPGGSTSVTFEHRFDGPGEIDVRIPPAYRQTTSVVSERTPTPSLSPEPVETSEAGPGFGILAALAGIAGASKYVASVGESEDR